MRLYDLIYETPQHDLAISVFSKQIADYIVDQYAPTTAKKVLRTQTPVNSGLDPELEYAMLSGKQIRNGYIAGYDMDEIPSCTFNVGKVKDIISNEKNVSVFKKISNVNIVLSTFNIKGRDDRNAEVKLGRGKTINLSIFLLNKENAREIIQSNIAHEFRHIIDFNLSKGNAPFVELPSDEQMSDMTSDELADVFHGYTHNQTEANARYTQAVNDLVQHISNNDMDTNQFKQYLNSLVNKYELDKSQSEKQTKRFMARAYNLYKYING